MMLGPRSHGRSRPAPASGGRGLGAVPKVPATPMPLPAGVAQPSLSRRDLLFGPLHLCRGCTLWVSWEWLTCQPSCTILGFPHLLNKQEGSPSLL